MQVSSACIPKIMNYAEALEHFNQVMPYRSGSQKGIKPLGSNRRYKYLSIAKGQNDEIYLQFVKSNIVTFHSDGYIVVSLCKWDTVGTRQFVAAATPFGVTHERGQTYLRIGDKWYAFADSDTPIIVQPDGTVRDPIHESIYRLNAKAIKSKRAEYSGFIEYVKNMGNVLVGIKDTEIAPVAERHRSTFAEFNTLREIRLRRMELPYPFGGERKREGFLKYMNLFLSHVKKAQETEDLQGYYDMFVLLGASSLNYSPSLNSFIKSNPWRYPSDISDDVEIGSRMLEFFDEIIKHIHREEVFDKIVVPVGKKVSNHNRKYFK